MRERSGTISGFSGSPILKLLLGFCILSLPWAPATAQTDDKTQTAMELIKERSERESGPEESDVLEPKPATELQTYSYEMREHLKKMRLVAMGYHLSESKQESRNLKQQWPALLATGRKIHSRMVKGALKDFLADKNLESDSARFLFTVAARSADADRFDEMLEVVQTLKEAGFTDQQFDLCFGLTASAHSEFALAKPHLEVAVGKLNEAIKELSQTKGIPDEQMESIATHMGETHGMLSDMLLTEKMEELWKEELELRAADAAGPPLPRVLIQTTKGDFEVELFEDQSPNTVANFISLCEKGFYDGLPFHRVLTHFMAQGGCPNRDGSGGPGYTIATELDVPKVRNFFRGTLGMAMSNAPDSGGSQFFVCYMPRPYLNGKYVAFGRVIEGMDVLSDFTHINPDDKSEEPSGPADEIIATKIIRKRDHAYTPVTKPAPKT